MFVLWQWNARFRRPSRKVAARPLRGKSTQDLVKRDRLARHRRGIVVGTLKQARLERMKRPKIVVLSGILRKSCCPWLWDDCCHQTSAPTLHPRPVQSPATRKRIED